jgi:hypothetical protein
MTNSRLNLLSKEVKPNEYPVESVILLNAFTYKDHPNTLQLHAIPDSPSNRAHAEKVASVYASERSAWETYSNAKSSGKAQSTIDKHEKKAIALKAELKELMYSGIAKSETYIDSDFAVSFGNKVATMTPDEFNVVFENAIYDLATCLATYLGDSGQDFRQAQLDKVRAYQENYNLTTKVVMDFLIGMVNELRGVCVFQNITIKKTWTGKSYAKITKPYKRANKSRSNGGRRGYVSGRTV